jgi:hypothetical protein
MKLFEAMKKVWENDVAWLTKNNALQWLTLCFCAVVTLGPLAIVTWFGFVYARQTPWSLQLPLMFACLVWAFFWFRVFDEWWPF